MTSYVLHFFFFKVEEFRAKCLQRILTLPVDNLPVCASGCVLWLLLGPARCRVTQTFAGVSG